MPTVAAVPFELLALPGRTAATDSAVLAAGLGAGDLAGAVAAHHRRARRLVESAGGTGLLLFVAGGGAGALALAVALRGLPVDRRAAVALLEAVGPRADPRGVAHLTAAIGPTVLSAVAAHRPDLVGPVDGMPVAARDAANRLIAIRGATRAAARGDHARAAALRALATAEPSLLLVDPERGLAAQALGDVESAEHVVVVVPGMGNTLERFAAVHEKAAALRAAAAGLDPPADLAAVAWLGYDSPSVPEVVLDDDARAGGAALARFVDGLGVAADATVTAVGHSYGSVVVGAALAAGLRVDRVAVTGSPGMLAPTAADLGATPVYALRAPLDVVAYTERFGPDPAGADFGATRLGTGGVVGHAGYFDAGTESLANLALVATGRVGDATVVRRGPLGRLVDRWDDVHERTVERRVDAAQAGVHVVAGVVSDGTDAVEGVLPGWAAGAVDRVQDATGAALEVGDAAVDLAQRVTSPDAYTDLAGDVWAVVTD